MSKKLKATLLFFSLFALTLFANDTNTTKSPIERFVHSAKQDINTTFLNHFRLNDVYIDHYNRKFAHTADKLFPAQDVIFEFSLKDSNQSKEIKEFFDPKSYFMEYQAREIFLSKSLSYDINSSMHDTIFFRFFDSDGKDLFSSDAIIPYIEIRQLENIPDKDIQKNKLVLDEKESIKLQHNRYFYKNGNFVIFHPKNHLKDFELFIFDESDGLLDRFLQKCELGIKKHPSQSICDNINTFIKQSKENKTTEHKLKAFFTDEKNSVTFSITFYKTINLITITKYRKLEPSKEDNDDSWEFFKWFFWGQANRR